MRKSKIIKIDTLEITIKELRVRDIYELFSGDEDAPMLDRFDDLLTRCMDIDREQMLDMTPSDLKTIWDGFREVNVAFLDMAALVGIDDLPGLLKESLQSQFALSLQADTAP
jgi:hypothetical protein